VTTPATPDVPPATRAAAATTAGSVVSATTTSTASTSAHGYRPGALLTSSGRSPAARAATANIWPVPVVLLSTMMMAAGLCLMAAGLCLMAAGRWPAGHPAAMHVIGLVR
jgi:hypothetical protein